MYAARNVCIEPSPDFFFADIPLLYETDGDTLCDRVVVVACSPDIERRRLLQRGSIDERAAGLIAAAVAIWLRASLPVVVIVAAVVAAAARAIA